MPEMISQGDIDALKADIEKMSGNVKQLATDILAKVNSGQELTQELKDKVDVTLSEVNADRQVKLAELAAKEVALAARVDDLEQRGARRGGLDEQMNAYRTPGQRFIDDQFVKDNVLGKSSWRGRARVDMAAITTVTAGATRDVLVPFDRVPGIVQLGNRRMTIRDLLTPGRTSQNAVQFVQEVGFDNQAGTVSEGATKPQSDIDYKLTTVNVATIAHWIAASKQILDDAPQLESQIDGRLRYGLAYVEEQQLLSGSGTGTDISGLITQATAFSRTFTPELPTRIDDIRLAVLQTELAYFPATGVVLHPTDWARIETTKDTQGKYLVDSGAGQGNATPRLWGNPVVSTQAITATKFTCRCVPAWGADFRSRRRRCGRDLDRGQRQLPSQLGHSACRGTSHHGGLPPGGVHLRHLHGRHVSIH